MSKRRRKKKRNRIELYTRLLITLSLSLNIFGVYRYAIQKLYRSGLVRREIVKLSVD